MKRERVEGATLYSDGSIRVGGSPGEWQAFLRTAGPGLQHRAYLAVLEALPGVLGEVLRSAYKVGGKGAVAKLLREGAV